MKTQKIYILLFLLFAATSTSLAQTDEELKAMYPINAANTVGKKLNRVQKDKPARYCDFMEIVDEGKLPAYEIFEKVFSWEKISYLADKNKKFVVPLFINSKGEILSMRFVMGIPENPRSIPIGECSDLSSISLRELFQIEELIKKIKFKIFIIDSCDPETSYMTVSTRCDFPKLKKYIEDKKQASEKETE